MALSGLFAEFAHQLGPVLLDTRLTSSHAEFGTNLRHSGRAVMRAPPRRPVTVRLDCSPYDAERSEVKLGDEA